MPARLYTNNPSNIGAARFYTSGIFPTTSTTTTTTTTGITTTTTSTTTTTTTINLNDYACVSGAGSPINGTYIFSYFQTLQEVTRPVYTTADGNFIIGLISSPGGPKWTILDYINEDFLYIGNTQPSPYYPWQETSWSIFGGGIAPVPTITQGPC